jgi:hypothetical protein
MFKRLSKDKAFTLMCCFSKIQDCEKWRTLKRMLKKKGKEGSAKVVAASMGCPVGNKKAEEVVAATAQAERVQSLTSASLRCKARATQG